MITTKNRRELVKLLGARSASEGMYTKYITEVSTAQQRKIPAQQVLRELS